MVDSVMFVLEMKPQIERTSNDKKEVNTERNKRGLRRAKFFCALEKETSPLSLPELSPLRKRLLF